MDNKLKGLFKKLGGAIDESLSDSDRISKAIGEIKQAGYDIFLVIEVTIAVNGDGSREDNRRAETTPENKGPIEIKLTPKDVKFLHKLRVKLPEEE